MVNNYLNFKILLYIMCAKTHCFKTYVFYMSYYILWLFAEHSRINHVNLHRALVILLQLSHPQRNITQKTPVINWWSNRDVPLCTVPLLRQHRVLPMSVISPINTLCYDGLHFSTKMNNNEFYSVSTYLHVQQTRDIQVSIDVSMF